PTRCGAVTFPNSVLPTPAKIRKIGRITTPVRLRRFFSCAKVYSANRCVAKSFYKTSYCRKWKYRPAISLPVLLCWLLLLDGSYCILENQLHLTARQRGPN